MRKIISAIIAMFCLLGFSAPIDSSISAREAILSSSEDEGISAKSYVQEGLVVQWDGIENVGYDVHDHNASVWLDLKNQVQLPHASFDDNFAVPTGRMLTDKNKYPYYVFNINHDFTMHSTLMNAPRFWGNWAEIGIGTGSGLENGIVLSARDGAINYDVTYREAYSQQVYNSVRTGTKAGDLFTIDILFEYSSKTYSVYVDGIFKGCTKIDETHWNLDDKPIEFGAAFFYNMTHIGQFRVYDLMLYDRCLNEEEIQYNLALDVERFGL